MKRDAPPTPSPRRWRDVLRASVLVNVLLLALLLWSARRNREARAATTQGVRVGAAEPAPAPNGAFAPRRAGGPPRHDPSAERARIWSGLMSTNLRESALRLREAGCPPETVCDILEATSTHEMARLAEAPPTGTNYWRTGSARGAAQDERDAAHRSRMASFAALAREFGCEGARFLQGEDDLRIRLVVDAVAGFVPRERREAALAVFGEAKALTSSWGGRSHGILLPEEWHEIQAESHALERRLHAALTDAELAEATLRVQAASVLNEESDQTFGAIRITPDELRQLAPWLDPRTAETVRNAATLRGLLSEEGDAPPVPEEAREEAIRRILGAERAEELLARQSSEFSTVSDWTANHGLSPEVPRAVHAALSRFRRETSALRDRWAADPAGARAGFGQARDRVWGEMQTLLAGVPPETRDRELREWLRRAASRGWEERDP